MAPGRSSHLTVENIMKIRRASNAHNSVGESRLEVGPIDGYISCNEKFEHWKFWRTLSKLKKGDVYFSKFSSSYF